MTAETNETPVERRLREIRDSGTQCAIELPTTAERDALDAGREAIKLLREWRIVEDADYSNVGQARYHLDLNQVERRVSALLARLAQEGT